MLPAVSVTTAVEVDELAHRADTTRRLPEPMVSAGREFDGTELLEKFNSLVLLFVRVTAAANAGGVRVIARKDANKQRIVVQMTENSEKPKGHHSFNVTPQ